MRSRDQGSVEHVQNNIIEGFVRSTAPVAIDRQIATCTRWTEDKPEAGFASDVVEPDGRAECPDLESTKNLSVECLEVVEPEVVVEPGVDRVLVGQTIPRGHRSKGRIKR